MKFSQILAVAFAATTMACKCGDRSKTEYCCGNRNGIFSGDDCLASSISEHLREFRSCCGGQSDCDFPDKREEEAAKRDESGSQPVPFQA